MNEGSKMALWLKTTLVAFPLIGAACFFGMICKVADQAYTLILSPSWELLALLFRLLLAVGLVLVGAGLVAALLRPVWVGIIAFAFSGVSMLLGWQQSVGSGILALVYFMAGTIYTLGVARELSQRIRFSVRPIGEGQRLLLMALIVVACGSLYLGYGAHIERQGFSIPDSYMEVLIDQMEKRMVTQVQAEQRQEVVAKLREEFQRSVEEFERTVKPYERFIPVAMAIGMFTTLVTITGLLAWVPTVVLNLIFPLLAALRVTEEVSETREVRRLIIG